MSIKYLKYGDVVLALDLRRNVLGMSTTIQLDLPATSVGAALKLDLCGLSRKAHPSPVGEGDLGAGLTANRVRYRRH